MVVNTETWNELSDEHREIIETAAVMAENDVRERMSAIEAEAFEAAADNGMSIYTPSAEEIAVWREASQPVYEAFTDSAGALGKQLLGAAKGL